MSKKAVWLSDIEFIEMHSSDWERLESEAFEPDESVQAQLNENQQIVLDWLKREQIKRSTLDILIIRELAELIYHGYFSEELVYKAFMEINRKQQAQVLQAFTQWSIEQEKAE